MFVSTSTDPVHERLLKGDIQKIKDFLQKSPNWATSQRPDGLRPLHYATTVNNSEILELLLKQSNNNIEITDNDGNTALHHAVRSSDIECVKLLLIYGANPLSVNGSGKKPIDVVKDNDIKNFLADRMGDPATTKSIQMARIEFLRQIEAELPTNAPGLKSFILEMLSASQLFQDRCKEKIRELIKEKHQAYYKYRLLENAAGLRDRRNKGNYMSQVQTQQHLNEEQAATISYLQIQNSMSEPAISRLEECYRKSISELQDQYAQEIKALNDRVLESEIKLSDAFKLAHGEVTNLQKEINELKGGKVPFSGSDSQILQKVQTENLALQQKNREVVADRQALFEKFKTSDQLKQLHEKEIIKIRNDNNLNKKILQETMTKVLNESSKVENDEMDESSGQIVFVRGENGSRQIKGATVEKLIERLTQQTAFDSQFQAAFLLTFRSYTNSSFVFDQLIKGYRAADTANNPSLTGQTTQNAVHLRICKIIKSWIENYYEDFKVNKDGIMDKLNGFIAELEQNKTSKLAPIIKNALNRKLTDQPAERKISSQPKPKPLLPKSLAKKSGGTTGSEIERGSTMTLGSTTSIGAVKDKTSTKGGFGFAKTKSLDDDYKLTDLEPLEVARQLTLIEYELFTAIKPTEFLDQAWMKDDKEIRAPNICQMTKWSNHITHWIVSEIVSVKDNLKSRAAIYERVIMLAQHLEKMNNFNGVKEVLAALQSSSVYRLKRTQEAVSGKYTKIYENLMKLTSIEMNFKNLRAKVHASDPPLIPFPGIYQSDLVFMDTCNKSKLDNGLINFMKHQKIASYILELQVYQQTPYNFEYVPEIADYIRSYPVLDENEAYNNSLICEPRGS